MDKDDLTKKEKVKLKILAALKNLEIMGDCFAKEDAELVRGYIEMLETENQKLKDMFIDEMGGI